MIDAVRQIVALTWGKVGHCSRCMRTSVRVTIAAWIVVAITRLLSNAPFAVTSVLVLAYCASILTVLHIVAFSIKFTKRQQRYAREARSNGQAPEVDQRKRSAIAVFSRALVSASVVSAVPALLSLAVIKDAFALPTCERSGTCDCSKSFPFGGCSDVCNSCQGAERKQCHETFFQCTCDCVL
jgi:hypothetical protein